MIKNLISKIGFLLFISAPVGVVAQDDSGGSSASDLAKQLANPVASLISVPLQNNFEFNVGPNEGFKYLLNVQPVIPMSLSENWNLISRTIVPIVSQSDVFVDGQSDSGMGDIAQSLFFSPKEPTEGGLVWGVGPVLLLPTATNDALGAHVWGAGPNAVFLKLKGQLTYGALINHMWSYAGDGNPLSASFVQPFFTYATPSGSSYTIAAENTQSWLNDIFTGFIGVYYAKVTKLGKQMIQLGGGPKVYYGNSPLNPDWGLRLNLILLYPKS
ncbi:hypothetical protein [Aegicerativicinus sediminis]|uniref:hypothetical protein n=1 Tax=Aegicerativicinus sediminis TaxID=2893202 RepID=UPI001E3192E3|nr:hypothetical protein [Aegicerativicinus sediminis]